MTWDQRKCSLFTVQRSRAKTNRVISPSIRGEMGPGKVFTIKRCSLIRGVHYERFHCILFTGLVKELCLSVCHFKLKPVLSNDLHNLAKSGRQG